MVGPGGAVLYWCLPSLPIVLLLWFSEPGSLILATPGALNKYPQCWPYRELRQSAQPGTCSKTDVAAVGRAFRKWELGIKMSGLIRIGWGSTHWGLKSPFLSLIDWLHLMGWHLSGKTSVYEESECFQLVAYLLQFDSYEKSKKEHLRLRWLCLDDSRFENDIERALGPPDLARTQALRIHELTEVIVVGKDKNFVFAAF